jgi:four helix bundle protein
MQKEVIVDYPYEKLDVWKKAVDFTTKIISAAGHNLETTKHQTIVHTLMESSAEIATAIAEGKSYPTGKDFTWHLYRSRGAVYKTMTLLQILAKQKIIPGQQYVELEEAAQRLTAMLSALMRSIAGKKSDHAQKPK